MKVLLVHPDDGVLHGPWRDTSWDLIVDFGWSGHLHYPKLTQDLGCTLVHYRTLLSPDQHRTGLREILASGLGSLIDSEGLDWWDVLIPYFFETFEQIILMSALADELQSNAEIAATRPHTLVNVLETILARKIKQFLPDQRGSLAGRIRRYGKAFVELRASQLAQVACDKWDGDYGLRRLLSRHRNSGTEPAILLPSAYENVSRTQASYARTLPNRRFLQVVARRNGRIADLPPNVEMRPLAAYAPLPFRLSTDRECDELVLRWDRIQSSPLADCSALRLAHRMGIFAGVPKLLRNGLRIRDAWVSVFQNEPICAVLSADENNPLTRMPVLLARARNLPTTYVDHGALNLVPSVRLACSDIYLARGEMARDYWVGWCGLPAEQVAVGDPVNRRAPASVAKRDAIVFFSEPYELDSVRVKQLYQDVLPPLCSLAVKTGHKLLVKLHQFESLHGRRRLIRSVLSPEQRGMVEFIAGPLTTELLQRTWCGLTVESSVALECALHDVPCFLLHWFDVSWFGYGRQFARFGAGHILNSAEAICEIPGILDNCKITPGSRQRLSTSMDSEQLMAVLAGSYSSILAPNRDSVERLGLQSPGQRRSS